MAIANDVFVTQMSFDYLYYLSRNADVEAAVKAGDFGDIGDVDGDGELNTYADGALYHFNTWGWEEGRDPNAAFDTSAYLLAYSDVADSGMNPLDHYLDFGVYEDRVTNAESFEIDVNADDDGDITLAAYEALLAIDEDDLTAQQANILATVEANWDGESLIQVYDMDSFAAAQYLAANDDVADAQPDDMTAAEWAYFHYHMHGQFESTRAAGADRNADGAVDYILANYMTGSAARSLGDTTDTADVTVDGDVDGESYDAADADVTFTIEQGEYAYTIENFGEGDVLDFDGITPTVINQDGDDLVLLMQRAENGQVATITLEGVAEEADAAIFNVPTFIAYFGEGSLVA